MTLLLLALADDIKGIRGIASSIIALGLFTGFTMDLTSFTISAFFMIEL